MILTIVGLFLNFIGSALLIYDALISFGKPKTIFTPFKYDKNRKPIKFIREKKVYGINDGWGGYKEIKISKEEIKNSLEFLQMDYLDIVGKERENFFIKFNRSVALKKLKNFIGQYHE